MPRLLPWALGVELVERLTLDEVDDTLAAAAFDIERQVKTNLVEMNAVDTGNLLNSYAAVNSGKHEWEVGSPVEYAPFIEFGTSRGLIPRPALARAFDDVIGRFQSAGKLG